MIKVFPDPISKDKNAVATVMVKRHTERELISGLRLEQIQVFNTLYDQYCGSLFGVIFKIVNQQETAEDLLQDVFIKIKRNFSSYDEGRARLFTWMLNIARNTAIDHLRLKSTRQDKCGMVLEDAALLLNSYSYSFNTDTLGMKKLIDGLSHRQRLLIDLCYYKGYSHAEIAEHLNMPLGSVKTTLRQAVLALRCIFQIPGQ
ncbi:RNA polymerase sigma factor [Pedobacter jeongneungensis]|uniref:RNA polymerase sigma factor n=1 Tax=Pedobacter jeongneungensis TaxID=947309 RepID=UPI00046AD743|nr:sigma-70 family RNA polymerase sigma factor [Pedobacter jeongneungensis]